MKQHTCKENCCIGNTRWLANLFSGIQILVAYWFILMLPSYAEAANIEVDSPQTLSDALIVAAGGDTILLSNGDYGQLDIHNHHYVSHVTLTPMEGNSNVIFDNIDFQNSSYIRLDGLTITPGGREGVGIFATSHHIEVLNSEIYGQNQFNRAAPDYTQVSTLYGINTAGNVHNLLIENINAHDFESSAYLFTSIADSTIRENRCDWVASDCYKFASANGILFENNFGASHIYSSPTAHVDFVQAQGTMSNSIFRGNVAIMKSRSFQGLFFDDATFTNLTFENNLISTASIRGISVSGASSTGIIARYNTVLRPGGSQKASLILLPSGSVKEFNIESNNVTKNPDRFPDTNIIAQWDDIDDIAHYDQYYTNATVEAGATIQDFTPVESSPADGTVGAFLRIRALLEAGDPDPPGDGSDAMCFPLKSAHTVMTIVCL